MKVCVAIFSYVVVLSALVGCATSRSASTAVDAGRADGWPARNVTWRLTPQARSEGWVEEPLRLSMVSGAHAENTDPRSRVRGLIYDWYGVNFYLERLTSDAQGRLILHVKLENKREERIVFSDPINDGRIVLHRAHFVIEGPTLWWSVFKWTDGVVIGAGLQPGSSVVIEAVFPEIDFDSDALVCLSIDRLVSKPASIRELKKEK